MSRVRSVALLVAASALTSCEREAREFRSSTSDEWALRLPSQTSYRVAATPPEQLDRDASADPSDEDEAHYTRNAASLSEGKWLYVRFNCHGCHAGGGGGDMGPPLIDSEWRYGHRPSQVFRSILQGRPNGMPAFASRITTKQTWELTAYVRSMSGLAPGDSSTGRDDHMKSSPPPNSIDNEPPREVGPPSIPHVRPAGDAGTALR